MVWSERKNRIVDNNAHLAMAEGLGYIWEGMTTVISRRDHETAKKGGGLSKKNYKKN